MSKKIVYASPFIPAEWILAHGLDPCRMACRGNDQGGTVHVISGVCPFMRRFINNATEDPDTHAIILTTECDQMRRGFDHIVSKKDIRCFLMNIPATSGNPGAHKLYRDELKRLGDFLVSAGGESPDKETLIRAMLDHDRKRKALVEGRAAQTARGFAMTLERFYDTGEISSYETKQRPAGKRIPVGIIGGPFTSLHFEMFDILDRNNAEVVIDGTENGVRTFPAGYDRRRITDDTMRVLAEAYFGSITNIGERPNNRIFLWIKKTIESFGIRGMVIVRYIWCDKWHSEVRRLREWLNIPVLDIELGPERIDERTMNRVEAFMEILA